MRISIERLEDKVEEISQKQFKKARRCNMEKMIKKLENQLRKANIWIIRIQERDQKENEKKRIIRESFQENVPCTKLHEFPHWEAYWGSSTSINLDPEETYIVKFQSIRNKEKDEWEPTSKLLLANFFFSVEKDSHTKDWES